MSTPSPYLPLELPLTNLISFKVTLADVILKILDWPNASIVRPKPLIIIGEVIFTHESSHHISVPIVKTIFLGKSSVGISPGVAVLMALSINC